MKIWESLSIRVKLTSAFLLTLLILFFINLFLYMNVNSMLERVNEVYQSNSRLNEDVYKRQGESALGCKVN